MNRSAAARILLSNERRAIRRWMCANFERFVERSTAECDLTKMVETWDIETQDGGVTADPDHVAWDVAVAVSGGTP